MAKTGISAITDSISSLDNGGYTFASESTEDADNLLEWAPVIWDAADNNDGDVVNADAQQLINA